jgi:hypothetical protein
VNGGRVYNYKFCGGCGLMPAAGRHSSLQLNQKRQFLQFYISLPFNMIFSIKQTKKILFNSMILMIFNSIKDFNGNQFLYSLSQHIDNRYFEIS